MCQGRGPGAVPHTRSPTWSTGSSRALLPTSATLNISIPTALLFLVNKLLKRVGWYRVASAGDENVPQSGAERREKLRAATLRTLEQWRREVCAARALPPQKTRAGEGRRITKEKQTGESQEAMLG